jgi:hypothetical protein
VPVSRSDPRRATIIGIGGVIVGVALIAIVLIASNAGNSSSTTQGSNSQFHVGSPQSTAASIARDGTPLFFNDTATGSRPLVVQHLGDDPQKGWYAFDAAPGSCVLTWVRATSQFTDCHGTKFPANGTGIHQYPVTVTSDDVIVDLSLNPTTTTTTGSTVPIISAPTTPSTASNPVTASGG